MSSDGQPGTAHDAGGTAVLAPPAPAAAAAPSFRGPAWAQLVRLARPAQWSKGAFVVVGPAYAVADGGRVSILAVIGAFLAFGFASSTCYIVNDIRDRDADRLHPRKCRRPIASGAVSVGAAKAFAVALGALALAAVGLVWAGGWEVGSGEAATDRTLAAALTLAAVAVYVASTTAYSLWLKRMVILDVVVLASGFVLRVLGGCAAALVQPSTWLLNCTLFLAMFLAFGKRLGERRTMGDAAASARGVQSAYTDDFLRMAVVVTAVATLVTYAGYVQDHAERYVFGFNLLWLTILPATYGLLRCIVLVERGVYDDPTELAAHDRPFQASVAVFGAVTAGLILLLRTGGAQ